MPKALRPTRSLELTMAVSFAVEESPLNAYIPPRCSPSLPALAAQLHVDMKARTMTSYSALLLLAGLTGAMCGCGPTSIVPSLAGSWEYRETARIKSPDPGVEAVLFTGDAGATTATTTYLYIVPSGGEVDPAETTENDACFVADHLKNLQVSWKGPRLLEIQYDEARIHHFHNRWHHRAVQEFRYVVELRLAPTSVEHSLPHGDRHW
jgi:hypothetical protein